MIPAFEEAPIWTISDLSLRIKQILENDLSYVKVRGEISGFKKHSSGHLYFALKDETSLIDCVSWRGSIKNTAINIEDGMEIIATGRITTYSGRSKYQMIVTDVELTGQGALLKILEDRKQKLLKEGLFDASRKKPLPQFPKVIGVVTSPTGAVIKDILHRISERYPCHVIIWPVAVQGNGAAEQVAKAIEGFNHVSAGETRPDVIIVARGGGSLEDLWAFNEEIVVRAAASSVIPLISAVGHETDVTLIDFASDKRAPTPTAAAEMATPLRRHLLEGLQIMHKRIERSALQCVNNFQMHLSGVSRSLQNPMVVIEEKMLRCDDLNERMTRGITQFLLKRTYNLNIMSMGVKAPKENISAAELNLKSIDYKLRHLILHALQKSFDRVNFVASRLESMSYENTLKRGFALATDPNTGKIIKNGMSIKPNALFDLSFADGQIKAVRLDKMPSTNKKSLKHNVNIVQEKLF